MPRAIQLTAFGPDNGHSRTDCVAIEAPLEVRLNGEPFAVIMRTPGDDEALALGFLLSESVIDGADDVAETVSWPGDAALGNRLNVVLTPDAADAAAAALAGRRRVAMSSACGLCGRVTIDSLRRDGAPIPVQWSVPTRSSTRCRRGSAPRSVVSTRLAASTRRACSIGTARS